MAGAEHKGARDVVGCYEELRHIHDATHGRVFLAREGTGKIVALKKLPKTAIRGIEILKTLQHDNVIKLLEIVTLEVKGDDKENETCMVLEYMDHDLKGLITSYQQDFTSPHIKCYMRQLLTGLRYCHEKQVLHRDITSSNILINNEGNLKLANFGSAQPFSDKLWVDYFKKKEDPTISLVCWAPELLFGATEYGSSIDMWSVGCVFVELLKGEPLFSGTTEVEQLEQIFDLCGSPDEDSWPDISRLPKYDQFKGKGQMKERHVREHFSRYDANAVDLLDKMLTLNPSKRISAEDALKHAYFQADTNPCDPKSLPKYKSSLPFQIMMIQPPGVGDQSKDSITSEPYLLQHNRRLGNTGQRRTRGSRATIWLQQPAIR